MWLLPPPIPSLTSPPASACSPAGSSSDSNCSAPEGSLWAVSSGTPVLRPRSWRGWQTRKAAARLFGTMREPSSAGVTGDWNQWMSSVLATHASRSAPPASDLGQKILDTFGLQCVASLREFNRSSCFSGTSTATSRWACGKSCGIARDSATALRRACSARRKWARRIFANGFLSWATARVANNGMVPCPESTGKGCRIEDQAALWATPNTARRGADTNRANRCGGGDKELVDEAANWPIPNAHPEAPNNSTTRENGKTRARITNQCMGEVARNWPTSQANDAQGTRNNTCLTNRSKHDGETLSDAMLNWPTTTTRDWKVGDLPPECRVGSEALTAAAEQFPSSQPTEPTTDDGLNWLLSVWTRPSCPRLSPGFQWWLMGWPHPRTFFAAEATASCHLPPPGRLSISPLASSWMSRNAAHLRALIGEVAKS